MKLCAPHRRFALLAAAVLATTLTACSTSPPAGMKPVTLVPKVDLPRFAGTWYVIANIPTFLEKGAHSATETYVLDPDGTMATTFSFHADAFDGPLKSYRSRGFVLDASHAVWGQQYIWPIKADYRISYLADDYSTTIITREKRDYVWIMARTPTIPEPEYRKLADIVAREGYDPMLLQRVPQR